MTTTFRRPCDKQEIKSDVDLKKTKKQKKTCAMEKKPEGGEQFTHG